jgi:integrase
MDIVRCRRRRSAAGRSASQPLSLICGPDVVAHLGKPRPGAARVGEARSLLTLLAFAGLRIGEALALRNRDLRLHARPRRLDVLDAKTPTGIGEGHLSPQLAEVLILHREQRRREARPTGNHDFLGTAHDGGPRSYTWALKKVTRAARIASERRDPRGLPPLPAVTPHTLRHTYISILLLVTDNVPYAMEQVGATTRPPQRAYTATSSVSAKSTARPSIAPSRRLTRASGRRTNWGRIGAE